MLDSFPARRPDDPKDPEGYDGALAAALCNHPREVAEDCADTSVGVVQECLARHGLTAGRINDWCTRHSQALVEFIRREDEREDAERKARKAAAEAREAELSREGRLTLDELRARHGRSWGLKGVDALDVVRGIDPATVEAVKQADREMQQAKANAFNEELFRREYAKRGLEPVRDSNGVMLSPSLVAAINPSLLQPARPPQERRDGAEDEAAA